jgi:hypothetical protein
MDNDKRKYPRIENIFKLNYEIQRGKIATFSKDVSAGGVAFATDELLDENTMLALTFMIEGLPGEITANGKVIRSWQEGRANYAAVEFVNLPEQSQSQLKHLRA